MIKKQLLTLLFATLSSIIAISAQPSLNWKSTIDLKEKSATVSGRYIVNKDGVVVHCYRYNMMKGKYTNHSLHALNTEMKSIADVDIPDEYNGKPISCYGIRQIGGVDYLLFWWKENTGVNLMARAFDQKTLQLRDAVTVLQISGDYDVKKEELPFVRSEYNSDSSAIALVYCTGEENKSIKVVALDKDLHKMWDKSYESDKTVLVAPDFYTAVKFVNETIVFVYRTRLNKDQEKIVDVSAEGGSKYAFHTLVFRQNSPSAEHTWVHLEKGQLLNSLDANPQPDGSIICTGTYTTANSSFTGVGVKDRDQTFLMEPSGFYKLSVTGVFGLTITTNGPQPAITTPLYPLLAASKTVDQQSLEVYVHKKSELLGIRPIKAIPYPDGGVLIVLESQIDLDKLHYQAAQTFNNLILVRFDPDHKVKWISDIPKKQETFDRSATAFSGSIGIFNGMNNLHFVYLENIEKDPQLIIATVENDGQVKIKKNFAPVPDKVLPLPSYGVQYSQGQFLLPAKSGSELKLGRIKI